MFCASSEIKYLFAPLEIRRLRVPSHLFLAPINTGFARGGIPTQRLIDFHERRSGSRLGISYVGNVAVHSRFRSNDNTAIISSDVQYKKLAEAIEKNGSLPGIQLSLHDPRIKQQKQWVNKNPEMFIKLAQRRISSCSEKEFEEIKDLFVAGAVLAREAGFKVIQIHAAHGYFLAQMINRVLNTRNDDNCYDRLKFMHDIVDRIRDQVPDIVLDLRVNRFDGIEDLAAEGYKTDLLGRICEWDIDMLSISSGFYNINKHFIYPAENFKHAYLLDEVIPLAKKFKHIFWNVAGKVLDLERLKTAQYKNITFSLGRALIADCKFADKYFCGEKMNIRECTRCNECHYYSRGMDCITCPKSDDL